MSPAARVPAPPPSTEGSPASSHGARGRRPSWLGALLATVGLAALLALTLRAALVPPPVVPATAPATDFSAERAMAHLREIARAPRPPGSAEHTRVREYIIRELRGLGLSPHVQEATGVASRYPVAGRVRNVVVRVPGTGRGGRAGGAVLLMAHYDGVAAGPAAGDAGSGVATLLETLRALRAGAPLRNDVIAVFTDAEERGLVGAAAFAREHPWIEEVGVVLNFEARGTRGRSTMFETAPGNAELVRALAAVPHATGSSLMYEAYRRMRNDTDYSELKRIGVQGLNFAFVGGVDGYHTPSDAVDRLDPRSMQHHGISALALARHFGSRRSPPTETRDAVFFDVALLGMIVYPLALALPLALLAGLAVAGSLWLTFRRARVRPAHVAVGLAACVVAAVLGAALAGASVAGANALHRARTNPGLPELSPLYAIMGIALAVAAAAAVQWLSTRWTTVLGLFAGAVVLWALCALGLAVVLPGAAHLFTWPAVGGALALIACALAPGDRDRTVSAAAWAAVVPAVLLLGPIPALLYVLLGSVPAGVAGAALCAALITGLAAPQIRVLAPSRRWAVPAAAAGIAVVLLAAGLATIRHDRDHPWRANLIYTLDPEAREARWVTTGPAEDPWSTQVFRDAGERGRLDPRFALPWNFAALPPDRILSAPAPRIRLRPPSVELLEDATGPDGRTLRLRIVSRPGANAAHLSVSGDAVLAASVDGRPVRSDDLRFPTGRWVLDYVAPPADGIELVLRTAGREPVRLTAGDAYPGPPDLPGLVPPRPPHVVPTGQGDLTLVAAQHTF